MRTQERMAILELLDKERQWWHGLDLILKSEGRLRRGIIYIHLSYLEDRGLVQSRQEDEDEFERRSPLPGSLRRRLYCITNNGIREMSKTKSPNRSFAPEPA